MSRLLKAAVLSSVAYQALAAPMPALDFMTNYETDVFTVYHTVFVTPGAPQPTPSYAALTSAAAYTPAPSAVSQQQVSTNNGFHYGSILQSAANAYSWAPSATPATTLYTSAIAYSSSAPSSTPASGGSGGSDGSSSGSGNKRGVAYNDASLAELFNSYTDHFGWLYNWGSSSSGYNGPLKYIPMLWGMSSDFTGVWSSAVESALSAGSTEILAFNEPDNTGQSNLSPSEAAQGYKTYLQPYAGKATLGSPAVTNGGGSMGLTWLSNFYDACSDCTIDATVVHWYNNVGQNEDFKNFVTQAHQQFGKPVWVTEFGLNSASQSEASDFLNDVVPWLDEQDFVHKYAYFMAADGFLTQGDSLSTSGQAYAACD